MCITVESQYGDAAIFSTTYFSREPPSAASALARLAIMYILSLTWFELAKYRACSTSTMRTSGVTWTNTENKTKQRVFLETTMDSDSFQVVRSCFFQFEAVLSQMTEKCRENAEKEGDSAIGHQLFSNYLSKTTPPPHLELVPRVSRGAVLVRALHGQTTQAVHLRGEAEQGHQKDNGRSLYACMHEERCRYR